MCLCLYMYMHPSIHAHVYREIDMQEFKGMMSANKHVVMNYFNLTTALLDCKQGVGSYVCGCVWVYKCIYISRCEHIQTCKNINPIYVYIHI